MRSKFTTKILRASPSPGGAFCPEDWQDLIQVAAEAIIAGELVAFPTETVYGLGANAFDSQAILKIYEAKGRPQDNPLIVHLADLDMLSRVAHDIPEAAYRLYRRFAPGPLSLILPAHPQIPKQVTAGLDTVAVRFPAHPLAQMLIRTSGRPLVAPSANLSGKPSPTLARDVLEDMRGRIPYILDGGPSQIGVESTVLDLSSVKPCILRPGGIKKAQLEAVLGCEVLAPNPTLSLQDSAAIPKAPGMKYRHYAPQARVELIYPEDLSGDFFKQLRSSARRIAFFVDVDLLEELTKALPELAALPSEELYDPSLDLSRSAAPVLAFNFGKSPQSAAHHLFAAFRAFDRLAVELIYAQAYRGEEATAYMNRLEKAAKPPRI